MTRGMFHRGDRGRRACGRDDDGELGRIRFGALTAAGYRGGRQAVVGEEEGGLRVAIGGRAGGARRRIRRGLRGRDDGQVFGRRNSLPPLPRVRPPVLVVPVVHPIPSPAAASTVSMRLPEPVLNLVLISAGRGCLRRRLEGVSRGGRGPARVLRRSTERCRVGWERRRRGLTRPSSSHRGHALLLSSHGRVSPGEHWQATWTCFGGGPRVQRMTGSA